MANTIKFGDGQWATKEDSILAYNDENANFKPLPFVTSRASTATRVNKSGLLETVASGVPRVDYLDNSKGSYLLEPTSRNLITQSEAFGNTYWTKSGASIEGDASTAGSEEVVNGDFASGITGWTANVSYPGTLSVVGGELQIENTGTDARALQAVTTVVGQLYLLNATITNIDLSVGLFLKLSNSNNLDSAYYNSSVNSSTTPLDVSHNFVATSTTTYLGVNCGGASGQTSLLDNVSVKEVQGFSAPSVDSPLGAFKLVESNNTESHLMFNSVTVASGESHTTSVYVKADNVSWVRLFNDYGSFNSSTYYDLTNATIGTDDASGSTITSLSNGWYRITQTDTTDQTGFKIRLYLADGDNSSSYTGDGTSGVYIFGAQLEQKSYPTSYIPTKGSQISRLSESASQTVPDGIIGQTEGTVYAEVNLSSIESMGVYCGWKIDGTSGNQLAFIIYPNGRIQATVFDGGSLVVNINDNNYGLTSGKHKIAFAYKQNDYILYVDGSVAGSDTSATVPIVNEFDISYRNGGSLKYNQTKLYNTRLSNSELATLTTI